MRNALADDFQRIGLDLTSFQIIGITPPDSVQHSIDERTSMSVLGDSLTSHRGETATALGGVAETPALEGAQTGLDLGAGAGVGQVTVPTTRETLAQPARRSGSGTIECPNCHAQAPADARFCPNCGRALQQQAGQ
jgi:membrane protease subunit (stomatin/prohibitin family)